LTNEHEIFPCNIKNCLVRLRVYGEFTKPNTLCRKRSLCKNEARFSAGKIERFNKIYVQESLWLNRAFFRSIDGLLPTNVLDVNFI
jgi:hypothetical protein